MRPWLAAPIVGVVVGVVGYVMMHAGRKASRAAGSGAQRSPDEIERDIDATREELSRALDALRAKLSLRRRVDSAMDSARHKGRMVADVAIRTVKQYPGPVALIGLSLVWLVATRWRAHRHRL